MSDLVKIKEQALKEIKEESFKKEVELYKEKYRKKQSDKKWWHILFPYKIVFIKREQV